jgi:hypothetical protein
VPAISAARENARRAQCISNQKQVAFALLNYEHTKGSFPALRAPLKPAVYPHVNYSGLTASDTEADATELTWVGFLLPFMEQNTAWAQINSGAISDDTLYELVLPVMQCRSSSRIAPGENLISYVANAGPINADTNEEFGGQNPGNTTGAPLGRPQRDARMYTIFFDHLAVTGKWTDTAATAAQRAICKTKVTVDNISSMDGTSMTILLSENEDAGRWIWYAANDNTMPVASFLNVNSSSSITPDDAIGGVEWLVGFCYPDSFKVSPPEVGEIPVYVPLTTLGTDTDTSPLFINEGRLNSGATIQELNRKARPSSGHPSVVIAAYCDGSVRPVKDDINKTLFVRLARPGSGVILNPKDLD